MNDVDVTMPQLGETVSEGTVSRWLVAEGSPVAADDPLLEVSTDKVDTEVVAPVSGVLHRIVVPEGETVPVGTVLAQLGGAVGSPVASPDTDLIEPSPAAAQDAAHASGTAPTRRHRHQDSPRVRRLAREHGVDLAVVKRSGRHERATQVDVRAAAGSPAEAQPPPASSPTVTPATRGRVERLTRRRRLIAEHMHRSLQETAQLTTIVEVDLTHVVKTREAAKGAFRARHGAPLSVLAFVAEAAVRALADNPVIHAELDLAEGTVTYPSVVDLGIAVDTEVGLVVPVIRGADDLTVGGLARRIAELAGRARDGSATADDFAGGTFTITNTGSRGALFDTPILNAPQSAILGLGAVVRRPVALCSESGDELIAIRSMAHLSLTYDHRLVDGADAARYLVSLKERLETLSRSWADSLDIKEAVR